jgi:8-oxo-dGTP diphosphatase
MYEDSKTEITVAKVLIRNDDGEFLMVQKASHYDWMADKWEQPGGKLEGDEDRFEAAKREVKTETGLELENLEDLVRLELEDEDTLVNCYVLYSDDYKGEIKLSEEHQSFRWADKNEALEMDWHRNSAYILPVIEYLEEYREDKTYGNGERIQVVKLLIENEDGKFLAMQKIDEEKVHSGHKYSLYGRMSGKWELPGGKFKESSNRFEAAKREIKEETGLELGELTDVVREEIEEENQVNTFILHCKDWQGEIELSKEHQDYTWVSAGEYKEMDWHQDAGYGYSPMAFLEEYLN